jgi:hypothetical protein
LSEPDFRALWEAALTYERFVAESTRNRELWENLYRFAKPPAWAVEALGSARCVRLLVLVEDWCGDAVNTVPVLARLADAAAGLELRVLRRDEHPSIMDRYLTNGSRSIPIVIGLDPEFQETGHWGPRPSELQEWVLANRSLMTKAELYPKVRQWYAKDRGETTVREVLRAVAAPHGDGTTTPGGEVQGG